MSLFDYTDQLAPRDSRVRYRKKKREKEGWGRERYREKERREWVKILSFMSVRVSLAADYVASHL